MGWLSLSVHIQRTGFRANHGHGAQRRRFIRRLEIRGYVFAHWRLACARYPFPEAVKIPWVHDNCGSG